jgi:GNAT superfamily N-acetyltransferase
VVVDWVRLTLDIGAGPGPTPPVPPGIAVTSLGEWGDSAEHRRAVYELNRTCSADIPGRGEFFAYEEWERLRLESCGTRFDGVVLAFHGDLPVGLCQLTAPPGRPWAFVEMTGVLRAWRRRGIAGAMKTRAFDVARRWGCTEVRTHHHPENLPAISANRALGFRPATTG